MSGKRSPPSGEPDGDAPRRSAARTIQRTLHDASRMAATFGAIGDLASPRRLLRRLTRRDVPAIHHLAVVVASLPRAERFYRGALGLRVVERFSDSSGRSRSVWLALGHGAFLAVERAERKRPRRDDRAPGWHCVALAIDLAAREPWRRKLERAGFPVFRETTFTLYTRDPDGNLVALSHHPVAAEVVLAASDGRGSRNTSGRRRSRRRNE